MSKMWMIKCPKCGFENPQDSKFCENCGSILEKSEFEYKSILLMITGGLFAAIVCGLFWGAISIITEYEFGFMASVLGALTCYSVIKFSKVYEGILLRIIAIISALLGIFIGKFSAFYYFFIQGYNEELINWMTSIGSTTEEALEFTSAFSPSFNVIIKYFIQGFPEIFSPFDVLWIALAILAVWRLPKSLKEV